MFVVTAPIFYANGEAHIGHLLSLVIADFVHRSILLMQNESVLITGSDEHGQKIYNTFLTAKEDSIDTFITKNILSFYNMIKKYNIDVTYFIRTSHNEHYKMVQDFFDKIIKMGIIYEKKYDGYYYLTEERFITEINMKKIIQENQINSNKFIQMSENNYCIKNNINIDVNKIMLNDQYIKEAIRYIQNTDEFFVTNKAQNSINITINNKIYSVYVWIDALISYITGSKIIGVNNNNFINIIGKDILRFHITLWPTILNILGYNYPKLIVHGLFKYDGKKISKSYNNLDLSNEILCLDSTLCRAYLLTNQCLDINKQNIINFNNSVLVNKIGNTINRCFCIYMKNNTNINNFDIELIKNHDVYKKLLDNIQEIDKIILNSYDSYNIWNKILCFINSINKVIDIYAPWQLDNNSKIISIILLEMSRMLITYIWPIVPKESSNMLYECFNLSPIQSKKMQFSTFYRKYTHMFKYI